MVDFPVHDPFQYYHVPRFLRRNDDIQRSDCGSISGSWSGIRGLRSSLNGFYGSDRTCRRRRILQLLHVSYELVPCCGRQGHSTRGFESRSVRPYRRYRGVGHEGADHAG